MNSFKETAEGGDRISLIIYLAYSLNTPPLPMKKLRLRTAITASRII
jgi:hypothetical protein